MDLILPVDKVKPKAHLLSTLLLRISLTYGNSHSSSGLPLSDMLGERHYASSYWMWIGHRK